MEAKIVNKFIFSKLVFIFIFNSCFFEEKNDCNYSIESDIASLRVYGEYLIAKNKSQEKLYYNVMPKDFISRIDLWPNEYPYIHHYESKKIYYNEINGMDTRIDTIVIFFWHLDSESSEKEKINARSHFIKIK